MNDTPCIGVVTFTGNEFCCEFTFAGQTVFCSHWAPINEKTASGVNAGRGYPTHTDKLLQDYKMFLKHTGDNRPAAASLTVAKAVLERVSL